MAHLRVRQRLAGIGLAALLLALAGEPVVADPIRHLPKESDPAPQV